MADRDYDDPRVLSFPGGARKPAADDDLEPIDDEELPFLIGPYPASVDGRDVFDTLVHVFSRFAVLPEGAPIILASWVIHTWAIYICRSGYSPRIIITAPTQESGKTNLMKLLAALVRKPTGSSEATPAWLYAEMMMKHTVFLDECQDIRRTSRIWTLANAGHAKSRLASVGRHLRTIPVFGALATAGNPLPNGDDFAPPAVASKGFKFKLKRKLPSETIELFDPAEHGDMMLELQSKIYRLVLDHQTDIRHAKPKLDRYSNRLRDNISPLAQIADVIGVGDRLRDAIDLYAEPEDIINPLEQCLRDVAEILFDPDVRVGDPAQPIGDFVFSSDLLPLLRETYPHRYAALSIKDVHASLRQFEIRSGQQRRYPGRAHKPLHGWARDAFDDALRRYVGIDPSAATPLHPREPPDMVGYSCAVRVVPAKRDARRAEALRETIEKTTVGSFWFAPDRVVFICPFFWVVRNAAGVDVFWHLVEGRIEMRGIDAERGIICEHGHVIVNSSTTLKLSDAEYRRWSACIAHYANCQV